MSVYLVAHIFAASEFAACVSDASADVASAFDRCADAHEICAMSLNFN